MFFQGLLLLGSAVGLSMASGQFIIPPNPASCAVCEGVNAWVTQNGISVVRSVIQPAVQGVCESIVMKKSTKDINCDIVTEYVVDNLVDFFNSAKEDANALVAPCVAVGACPVKSSQKAAAGADVYIADSPLCVGCFSAVAYAQQTAIETIQALVEPALYAPCVAKNSKKDWFGSCALVADFLSTNLVEFLNVVKNAELPPQEVCAAVDLCTAKAAAQVAKKPVEAVHLDRLVAANRQGVLPTCALCSLGVQYLEAQVASGIIATEFALAQVVKSTVCEADPVWGSLCDAFVNVGSAKLLNWMYDGAVDPTAFCQATDMCPAKAKQAALAPKVLSQRLAKTLTAHQSVSPACGNLLCLAECQVCQAAVEFAQAQVFIDAIQDGEAAKEMFNLYCTSFADGRSTGVAAFCQSVGNLVSNEIYKAISDYRLPASAVCQGLGSCPTIASKQQAKPAVRPAKWIKQI